MTITIVKGITATDTTTAGTVTSLTATSPIVITPSPTTTTGVISFLGSFPSPPGFPYGAVGAPSIYATSQPTTGVNFLAGTVQVVISGVAVATVTAALLSVAGTVAVAAGTITANTPNTISQTWNNSGVTFKALTVSVADQAANAGSASGSSLFQLLCGTTGTTVVFDVGKTGITTTAVSLITPRVATPASTNLEIASGATSNDIYFYNGASMRAQMSFQYFALGSDIVQAWSSTTSANGSKDLFQRRVGAANIALGAVDAASPVAQTLSVQNVVAGTSNTAGANLTIVGSLNTGSGAPGDVVMQTGQVGGSGTSQSAAVTAFTFRRGTAVLASYAVAGLPSASSAGAGATAFVTDASTTLILGLGLAVSGGGANKVPVYSDGTNWLYG